MFKGKGTTGAGAAEGNEGGDGAAGTAGAAKMEARDELLPFGRRGRRQELLMRAESALRAARRSQRLSLRSEAGAGQEHRNSSEPGEPSAVRGRLPGADEHGVPSDSDESEAAVDFDDLVRLYGPLPPLRPRRGKRRDAGAWETGGDSADEGLPGAPKRQYNLVMAVILMVLLVGLLCVIFAQARGQQLWLDRQVITGIPAIWGLGHWWG